MNSDIHLKQIIEFQKERDWKQFHDPKSLAISLSLEAAEALEVFQWTKDNALPEGKKEALAHELADVYWYLLLLAHETGIDLDDAFKAKIEINRRKYPAEKVKGIMKKYGER